MSRFRERLEKLRIERLDPPKGFESNGLWFRDPDGTLIEIRVAEKSSPNEKATFEMKGGDVGRAERHRTAARRTRCSRAGSRMSCCSSPTSRGRSISTATCWACGCRTAPAILVAFMHGIHGSDHHMIAFVKSDGPGLHHLSWDVGSINDIGVGASHMAEKGFAYGWGLGRHVLGSNYFHYVPRSVGQLRGIFLPTSTTSRSITTGRTATSPAEDSFYLWGPNPPEDFAHNFEIVK